MGGIPLPRMRWVDALVEAAKAVWYLFLRKSQLVEPVFAEPGSRPQVERGFAHLWWPRQRSAASPRFASEDPILRVLRQRAALELFEWLGLDQVPLNYWALLERTGDPSSALIAFIANNRFDPTLVRQGDATELAAFRNFVRFVCQVEEATDRVSERQRTLLDRYTYYGEHAAARTLLELFVMLNEVGEIFERSPALYRFAAFARHTDEVAAFRERAALADLGWAKALLETSRRYARLTWRFRNAAERMELIEAAAGGQWASLSPHDRDAWVELLADQAQSRSALMDDADCDVLEELDDFESRIELLAALLDEAARRRTAEERRRRQEQRKKREEEGRARPDLKGRDPYGLSQDELLRIFGFPPGASPELGALRRAFIREANKTQPVPGQPDYRERNDRYRILKDAYERLKISF